MKGLRKSVSNSGIKTQIKLNENKKSIKGRDLKLGILQDQPDVSLPQIQSALDSTKMSKFVEKGYCSSRIDNSMMNQSSSLLNKGDLTQRGLSLKETFGNLYHPDAGIVVNNLKKIKYSLWGGPKTTEQILRYENKIEKRNQMVS